MIAKSWVISCWQWKIGACVAIAGTLAVGLSSVVLAQIVPDNTLGAEGSVVTPNVNIRGIESDRIDNGAIRGANLFHSFEQFNVGAGRGAYFTNPAGIENILSRVTGANRSEILGRLGVLGNANLFLINPQGIVFGPTASLDVQGSFLATTADAVKLGDAGLFSAEQPAASNLLTVSPSAILFNTIAAQPIVNRSRSPGSIRQPNSAGVSPGLQVQQDRTLALVGGNVLLEGGRLTAAGGRIELGSVARVGEVSLAPSGNRFVLGYDSINDFGNISLLNRAFVDASGEGGGDVQIRGARLEMAQNSNIWADTLGAENGGEILVRAPEVVLSDSLLRARVASTGTGTGGDLTIDTGRLLVRDGAQVSATTFGEGKGGRLQINADSVDLIGRSADGQRSSGLSAQSVGSGDAGDLRIDTGRLLVSDGAEVSVTTFGEGKGGSLQITAADAVEVIGASDAQQRSALYAQSVGSGDGGNLTIDTGRLLVSDGAQASVTTFGAGKGGSLQITAADAVEVIGTSDAQQRSALYAQSVGSGDGGNLTIDTGRLLVSDGAEVATTTFGAGKGGRLQITAANAVEVIGTSDEQQRSGLFANSQGSGDAGNLTIDTGSLLVSDGAQVSLTTFSEGKGGSLQITAADAVEVIGESTDGQRSSGLFANSQGSGDAGNLTIDTGSLLVSDGAQVSLTTFSEGKGGNLQITAADAVEVIGISDKTQRSSGLFANSQGSGDTGNLTIDTGRLLIRDGAVVSNSNRAEGNGGSLQITAADSVELSGTSADGQRSSVLVAQNDGSGDAGGLTINTRHLLVRDGAVVSTNTFAESDEGNGGDINITTDSLSAINGASLTASTSGTRNAGNVIINASDTVSFNGSGITNITRGIGSGGDINITTGSLTLSNAAQVLARTQGQGNAGSIKILARNTVSLDGENTPILPSSIWSNVGDRAAGNGGSINIEAQQLSLSSNAALIGDVERNGQGRGGNINLDIKGTILLAGGNPAPTGESARITLGVQPGGIGSSGTLDIRTGSLVLRDGGIIKNSTQGQGDAGDVYINSGVVDISGSVPSSGLPSGLFTSTDTDGRAGNIVIDSGIFRIADGAALSARSKGDGQGGNIRVNATSFEAVNGGQLVTTTFGQGQAGAISVNATDRVTISGSDPNYTNRIAKFPNEISSFVANALTETGANSGLFANTETNSTGNGGNIRITTSNFNLTDSAQISASTSGSGRGGNLFVTAPQAIAVSGNGELSVATSGAGAGGNLTIETQRLTIQDGAQVSASTSSPNHNGVGGNITVNATQSLNLDQASLLAESNGSASAGSVTINTGNLTARDGTIATSSEQSVGGGITITASNINLFGDSDITTNVNQGAGGGGNIYLKADSILAFDDSDILAFARDGRGGDITLDTPAFFGENYRPAPRNTKPNSLDRNNRVDINATGAVSGIITTPDVSFIQNSLTELPENQINTDNLLANSCIVRRNQPMRGSFTVTGTGGLPQRPGDTQISSFPTVDVETLPSDTTPSSNNPNRSWQKGDPIIEPQGVYRLPNGKLVLSRECS